VSPVRSIRQPRAVLWALLPVGLLIPSLIWIAEDHTVWLWDQAWYGEVSADLWFWIFHSPRRWAGEMALGLSMKPPGIAWVGQFFVPLQRIFGSVEFSLLLSVLAAQFVLLMVLFRIGRRFSARSSLAAIAGLTLAAGTSLFVGLTHQFFVEPLQAAAVAWVYSVAIEAPGWTSPRIAVQLALAIESGLLAKADTPLYCILPCLYAVVLIFRKRVSRAELSACWKSRGFQLQLLLLGMLGTATALWYWINIKAVWQHVREASSGAVALHYGSRDSWLHKLVQWWGLFRDSFLSPYLGWVFLAVLAAACIFWALRLRQHRENTRIEPVAALGALQTLLILAVLSTTVTLEPRFLYTLLPGIAVVFMQLCALLPPRFPAAAVIACGAQWAVVNAEALAMTGIPNHQSQWLLTPGFDRAQFDDLTRVVSLTSNAPERYNIVALDSPWMNAYSADFFAAKNRFQTGVRSYYTSLGYAETDFGAAMRRIEKVQPRYVITIAEPFQVAPPDFLNSVSLPVLRDMRSDDRFSQVPFASRNGVLVFQYKNGFRTGVAGSAP